MCSCKITDPYIKSLSLTWQLCALVTKYYNRWILRIASVVGGTLCSLSITLRPCRGGGPMSPVWILKRLMAVFINACRLLLALPSLWQFCGGRLSLVAISFYMLSLLFGPCRLSEFTLAGPLHSTCQQTSPHHSNQCYIPPQGNLLCVLYSSQGQLQDVNDWWKKHNQALNSTFINSEALSHFNLLKKEQMFLVQQLPHLTE